MAGRRRSVPVVAVILLAATLLRDFHPTMGSTSSSPLVPAFIILGDSTVDVGTNNHLLTVVRCDFDPYGRDLQQLPRGRFSNGLLVPDYLARELGLPFPISYSDTKAEGDIRLLTGANFASSGSGWLNLTAQIYNVVSFSQQVQNLKEYKSKLISLVGDSRAAEILGEALFLISTGTNDYILNYYLNPALQAQYNISQFEDLLITTALPNLQEVYNIGARKIVLSSLPAMGCLPAAISVLGSGGDDCVASVNEVARNFDATLKRMVPTLNLEGAILLDLDGYSLLSEVFENPSEYVAITSLAGLGTNPFSLLQDSKRLEKPAAGRARSKWPFCATRRAWGRARTPPNSCSSTASTRPKLSTSRWRGQSFPTSSAGSHHSSQGKRDGRGPPPTGHVLPVARSACQALTRVRRKEGRNRVGCQPGGYGEHLEAAGEVAFFEAERRFSSWDPVHCRECPVGNSNPGFSTGFQILNAKDTLESNRFFVGRFKPVGNSQILPASFTLNPGSPRGYHLVLLDQ